MGQSSFKAAIHPGVRDLWCWWPKQVGIVLMHRVANRRDLTLDELVTLLSKEERAQVTIDLTAMVLNPPKWG